MSRKNVSGARQRYFRPCLESLETRELLASSLTASVYGNVLQIQDSRAGDTIHVHQLNGQISVDGISIATNNGMKPNISASAVSRIEISTPAGHDQVWLGDVGHVLNLPVVLTEGAVDTLHTPTDTKGAALPANAKTMLQTPNGSLYALTGGTVLESATGATWQAVSGLSSVNQLATDGSGRVYALLSNNTLYSITGTHATSVAKGVTAMAVDAAGELVMVQGNSGYSYLIGGLPVSGGVINSTGATPLYAIDDHGNLYTLFQGKLTSASSYLGRSQTLATGVTYLATTPSGAVFALQGPHTYMYFDNGIGTSSTSPTATYAMDADGNFYTLQNTLLTVQYANGTTSVLGIGYSQMVQLSSGSIVLTNASGIVFTGMSGRFVHMGTLSVVGGDGSLYFLGSPTGDSAGDQPVYQVSNGQMKVTFEAPSAIGTTWLQMGGPNSLLGKPHGLDGEDGHWYWQDFDHGSIYSDGSQCRVISGAIWNEYKALHRELGPLGLPSSHSGQHNAWTWQEFERGAIYTDGINTYTISGPIWTAYQGQNQSAGSLGLPAGNPFKTADGGTAQQFDNGTLVWSPKLGMTVRLPSDPSGTVFQDATTRDKIINQVIDWLVNKYKPVVQQNIMASYNGQQHDWTSNWGHTVTEDIPDGLNRNGTIHYRQVTLKDGQWQRWGFGAPQLLNVNLSLDSTALSRGTIQFEVKLQVDLPFYYETQLWEHGAQLADLTQHGAVHIFLDTTLILHGQSHYDPMNPLTGSAQITLVGAPFEYAVILDSQSYNFFKNPPDYLANTFLTMLNFLDNCPFAQVFANVATQSYIDNLGPATFTWAIGASPPGVTLNARLSQPRFGTVSWNESVPF